MNQLVFLASNFVEFRPVRRELKRLLASPDLRLNVFDLDDEFPDGRPPVERCLDNVRRSDLMVLLVGKRYGATPQGHSRSYVQLEYDAASALRGRGTAVLVFMYGNAWNAEGVDPRQGEWRRELAESRVFSTVDDELPTAEQARFIAFHVLAYLRWLRFETDSADDQLADGGSDEGAAPQDDVGDRDARLRDAGLTPDGMLAAVREESPDAMLPGQRRCHEHLVEAAGALVARDVMAASHHLRHASELKPRNFLATFWLARTYATRQDRKHLADAYRLARRAARLASDAATSNRVRSAVALALAADVAGELGIFDAAVDAGVAAVEAAEYLPHTHLAAAGAYARLAGTSTGDERRKAIAAAMERVDHAYRIYPPALARARHDRRLQGVRRQIDERIREVRDQLFDALEARATALRHAVDASRLNTWTPLDTGVEDALARAESCLGEGHYGAFLRGLEQAAHGFRALVLQRRREWGAASDAYSREVSALDEQRRRSASELVDAGVPAATLPSELTADAVDSLRAVAESDARIRASALAKVTGAANSRSQVVAVGLVATQALVAAAALSFAADVEGALALAVLFFLGFAVTPAALLRLGRDLRTNTRRRLADAAAPGREAESRARALTRHVEPLRGAERAVTAARSEADRAYRVAYEVARRFRDDVLHRSDLKTLPWPPLLTQVSRDASVAGRARTLVKFHYRQLGDAARRAGLPLAYYTVGHVLDFEFEPPGEYAHLAVFDVEPIDGVTTLVLDGPAALDLWRSDAPGVRLSRDGVVTSPVAAAAANYGSAREERVQGPNHGP